MSIPTSAIAAIADGFTSLPGSEPPDHATARSPARCLNHPSAICERPALCTQRNRTVGRPSFALPSTRAERLEALPGEALGHDREEVGRGRAAGELVVARGEEQLDRLLAEDALELFGETRRR